MDRTFEIPSEVASWVQLTSYDEIASFLRHPSARMGREGNEFLDQTVVNLDGSEHLARRQLESPLLSAPRLREYERTTLPRVIDAFLRETLSGATPGDPAHLELVQFGLTMLVRIGASIVGLDDIEGPGVARRLLSYVDAISTASNAGMKKDDPEAARRRGRTAREELRIDFLRPAVERRGGFREGGPDTSAKTPPADLISLVLQKTDWGEDRLLNEVALYLTASIRTTTRALCNVVVELHEWFSAHPEDRSRAADVEFLQAAVTETLRLHPVLPMLPRRTANDIPLADGTVVPAGSDVAILFAYANRDPAIFGQDAEDFDLRRSVAVPGIRNYGLAFGHGAHACIGRRLALGGAVDDGDDATLGTLTTLLTRLYRAGIELDPAEPPVPNSQSYYDEFLSLPVVLRSPGLALEDSSSSHASAQEHGRRQVVTVDESVCEGSGLCTRAYPGAFSLGANGLAVVTQGASHLTETELAKAVLLCPTGAIGLQEASEDPVPVLTFFHTGYVVDDLEAGMEEVGAATGLTWRPAKGSRAMKVWTPDGVVTVDARRTYSVEGPPYLELVEATGVWGPGAPAGEYHVGFWVDDLTEAAAMLEGRGFQRVVSDLGDLGRPSKFAYYRTPSGLRVEILPIQRREEILGP